MFRPTVPLLLTGAALLASGCSLQTAGHRREPERPISAARPLKPATVQDAQRLGEIRLGTEPDMGPALHTEA
jgi:hypothetical protein